MNKQSLDMLFEHNNWATLQIIEACSALTDEQLDAEPASATRGSIRATLSHLVIAQQNYLRLLTLPLEERRERLPTPPFAELKNLANSSGEVLLALAQDEASLQAKGQLQTRDNYLVEPWVIMVQIINHATEHREQIKSMLTALGLMPPEIDGWDFGRFAKALVPMDMKKSELLDRLQQAYQQWEEFIGQVSPTRMDQPGVNGDWSMKDMIAHLTGWNRWLVIRLQAALRGEPEIPYWPAHLRAEDDINAWIYEANRNRSVDEVLDETRQIFQQLFAVVEGLPDQVRIERVEPAYYLVWVGDKRFPAGEFFDHYRDEHEPDVRAWLKRGEKG